MSRRSRHSPGAGGLPLLERNEEAGQKKPYQDVGPLSVVMIETGTLIRATGSEAFLQSTRLNLDKARGTARKKTVGDSGGAASVLMGSWHEALRLTLDTSTLKKASLPAKPSLVPF